MDTFDDLFDRGIPQDVAQEYLSDLQKLAVSLSWVHRAATRGAKEAPTDRLLATASRSMRGAREAASKGNGDVAKKRLLLKSKVLDEALHRGGTQKAASLGKEAVSADWVGRMARSGVQNSTRARTQEVAGRSMKGVLDAVKKKGPNVQAHVDKRMALHQAANSPQRLSVGSVSSMAPPMRKAAEHLKSALSAEFVSRTARAAAQKASPQRVQQVAGGSMKKVLEAAKRKGPNAQAHVDKRMALRQGVLAGGSMHPPAFSKAASGLGPKLAAAVKSLVQAANEPPPEAVIMQEQQGQLQQALAENEQLHGALEESQGLIQEHAQAVQQAGEMAQQTQQQLQEAEMAGQEAQMQAQEQLAMAQQQAQMAQAEAQTQAAEAASQADGKMRLAIRIQQIRQQLADMASQDIVAEEGEQAEPLLTPGQQGMGDPNAPQDPAMAGQDPSAAHGAAPGGPPGAGGAEVAPPEGGGQAAPAAKPKPKKEKSEGKSESKAGPKTEIKIGSSNTYMKELAERLATRGSSKGARSAAGKASPRPSSPFSTQGTAVHQGLKSKVGAPVHIGKPKGFKGIGGRIGQLLTGSRARDLQNASVRNRTRGTEVAVGAVHGKGSKKEISDRLLARAGKLKREQETEKLKSLATQTGVGATALGGLHYAGRQGTDPARPPKRSGKQKRAELLEKLADAARAARLGKAVAKAGKNAIRATPPPPRPPGSSLARRVVAEKADKIYGKGDRALHEVDRQIHNQKWMDENAKKVHASTRALNALPYTHKVKANTRVHELVHNLENTGRVMVGSAVGGVAGGETAHQLKKRHDEKKMRQKAAGVERAQGVRRLGQLLSGSRSKALHAAPRTGDLGRDLKHGLDHLAEQGKVVATRAGAGAAGTTMVGGSALATKRHLDKKKVATEQQVRSDARRAAGRSGMIPAGALGALAGAAIGRKARVGQRATMGTAAGASLGASLLANAHGRAGFDKRELANDLHMERALTKAKRDRTDKALEKEAGLSDADLDRLYGLEAAQ